MQQVIYDRTRFDSVVETGTRDTVERPGTICLGVAFKRVYVANLQEEYRKTYCEDMACRDRDEKPDVGCAAVVCLPRAYYYWSLTNLFSICSPTSVNMSPCETLLIAV